MSDHGERIYVEERNLGDVAREEIEVARREGVDPMEIAQTHQRLGYIIPQLLAKEGQ